MSTLSEQKHKAALAEIGCAMCFHIHGPHAPGPVELHHLRGGGWGKGSYKTLIPLCANHHRGAEGIHHIGSRLWGREFGVTQQDLLDWALEKINFVEVTHEEKEPRFEHGGARFNRPKVAAKRGRRSDSRPYR